MPAVPSAIPNATLNSSDLPPRVQAALQRLLQVLTEEFRDGLSAVHTELDQQLFRRADHARTVTMQDDQFGALDFLREKRADFVPLFLRHLESVLVQLRQAPSLPANNEPGKRSAGQWQLVERDNDDEDSVLRDLAVRHESRSTLALYLLGQRFGVMAGAPAFDAETLPVGPRVLLSVMQQTALALDYSPTLRTLLYRAFEQHFLASYPNLAELMNTVLAEQGILTELEYVPIRPRRTAQPAAEATADPAGSRDLRAAQASQPSPEQTSHKPHTGWLGSAGGAQPSLDEATAFALLQQLLAGRHPSAPSATVSHDDIGRHEGFDGSPGNTARLHNALAAPVLDSMLRTLQQGMRNTASTQRPKSLRDVQHTVLAQARQQRGSAASLTRDDSDTFELLSLLYTELEREVRPDTPARLLLERLQVPLLRLALQDRAFFVRNEHPGRLFLNTVAESGAAWLADDDADPAFVQQVSRTVERVVTDFQGDVRVFEQANADLQQQVQSQARRAEMTERRHIESVRGKEKLTVAKQRALAVVTEQVDGKTLPRFMHTLLLQAWTDVLTLTLLRHDEDSDAWRGQLDATQRIIAATSTRNAAPDVALTAQIEQSLHQIGYHDAEAAAMARQLSGTPDNSADPASRTELSLQLKARTRLGEDSASKKPVLPPRSAEEQACHEHLRTLPFGTWFEFVTNQQGQITRRRLSWYSTLTDNALFVNMRGQRLAEMTLDALARMMVQQQVRIVTVGNSRLIDRAWQAALGVLRSFTGNEPTDHDDPNNLAIAAEYST